MRLSLKHKVFKTGSIPCSAAAVAASSQKPAAPWAMSDIFRRGRCGRHRRVSRPLQESKGHCGGHLNSKICTTAPTAFCTGLLQNGQAKPRVPADLLSGRSLMPSAERHQPNLNEAVLALAATLETFHLTYFTPNIIASGVPTNSSQTKHKLGVTILAAATLHDSFSGHV